MFTSQAHGKPPLSSSSSTDQPISSTILEAIYDELTSAPPPVPAHIHPPARPHYFSSDSGSFHRHAPMSYVPLHASSDELADDQPYIRRLSRYTDDGGESIPLERLEYVSRSPIPFPAYDQALTVYEEPHYTYEWSRHFGPTLPYAAMGWRERRDYATHAQYVEVVPIEIDFEECDETRIYERRIPSNPLSIPPPFQTAKSAATTSIQPKAPLIITREKTVPVETLVEVPVVHEIQRVTTVPRVVETTVPVEHQVERIVKIPQLQRVEVGHLFLNIRYFPVLLVSF